MAFDGTSRQPCWSGELIELCSAKVAGDDRRGWIIPIGGAEKKIRSSVILARFVELCGAGAARIVVIPTASQLEDTGERYVQVFGKMGAGKLDVINFTTPADAEEPDNLAIVKQATGIFFTGGNQQRLADIIGGTASAQQIRDGNARGVHVAGTSAGAAFLCRQMIQVGRTGTTPKGGMVSLTDGLGLSDSIIIDQHFRERDRLGRLLTALSHNPSATGLGVDEDTAAFIDPDNRIEVVGSGGLTVVDTANMTQSMLAAMRKGKPVGLIGVNLHILLSGDRYDLTTGDAWANSEQH